MTTRRRECAPGVPDRVVRLLLDEPPIDHSEEVWGLLQDRFRMRRHWEEHGAAVIAVWARKHPGTRPRSWWRYAAPAPRLLADGRPALYDGAPGQYEGQATYLERLELWARGERQRAPAAAWEPEEIRR